MTNISERLLELENKVSIMEGEKRHAKYITPIIVAVVMAVGGLALTAHIKNEVRNAIRIEMKTIINEPKPETSWLLSGHP